MRSQIEVESSDKDWEYDVLDITHPFTQAACEKALDKKLKELHGE